MEKNRAFFANSFCGGRGIEIGALHHPVRLPPESRVRYLDRMPVEGLRGQYRELAQENLVEVDIVDDGETLATLPDGAEDFVIAAQFIEHCQNPIRALVNMLRVIRDGGFVFLTVPDKRFTFDADRPLTSNQHLLEECRQGTAATARDHYREWVERVEKIGDAAQRERRVAELMEMGYSIHFHVWDSESFLQCLLFFRETLKLPFDIWATLRNGNELMVALRKRLG